MISLNWVDGLLLALTGLVCRRAMQHGCMRALTEVMSFVCSVLFALLLSEPVATGLRAATSVPPVWAAPVAFLVIWAGVQAGNTLLSHLSVSDSTYRASQAGANRWLAAAPGVLQSVVIGGPLLTWLAFAPIPSPIQSAILQSTIGAPLVQATIIIESPLQSIFGPALHQISSTATAEPTLRIRETAELPFRVNAPIADPEAEERMLAFLNIERSARGLLPLAAEPNLQQVARLHAADLLRQGYFAHTGRDGRSPFDRMHDAGIRYNAAGENLALAPTTEEAHAGLMTSPTHRANILNAQYHKIGIGVMDGGPAGKMFVQEFTD